MTSNDLEYLHFSENQEIEKALEILKEPEKVIIVSEGFDLQMKGYTSYTLNSFPETRLAEVFLDQSLLTSYDPIVLHNKYLHIIKTRKSSNPLENKRRVEEADFLRKRLTSLSENRKEEANATLTIFTYTGYQEYGAHSYTGYAVLKHRQKEYFFEVEDVSVFDFENLGVKFLEAKESKNFQMPENLKKRIHELDNHELYDWGFAYSALEFKVKINDKSIPQLKELIENKEKTEQKRKKLNTKLSVLLKAHNNKDFFEAFKAFLRLQKNQTNIKKIPKSILTLAYLTIAADIADKIHPSYADLYKDFKKEADFLKFLRVNGADKYALNNTFRRIIENIFYFTPSSQDKGRLFDLLDAVIDTRKDLKLLEEAKTQFDEEKEEFLRKKRIKFIRKKRLL